MQPKKATRLEKYKVSQAILVTALTRNIIKEFNEDMKKQVFDDATEKYIREAVQGAINLYNIRFGVPSIARNKRLMEIAPGIVDEQIKTSKKGEK